eukprot:SAG11_NODE_928_length_6510_cov_5.490251_4_plen_90_part_00
MDDDILAEEPLRICIPALEQLPGILPFRTVQLSMNLGAGASGLDIDDPFSDDDLVINDDCHELRTTRSLKDRAEVDKGRDSVLQNSAWC